MQSNHKQWTSTAAQDYGGIHSRYSVYFL